jgi:hypothetical protein
MVHLDPSHLWTTYMRDGKFERAWRISDGIMRTPSARRTDEVPRHLQMVWSGAPLKNKRVLVRCYHGLGDTIQFIRYAPVVRSVAAELIVLAQPKLVPLLSTMSEIDTLLPLNDYVSEVDYDVDIEVMELPYAFRTTLSTVPARIPYLHVRQAALVRGNALCVGIVWTAGDWDERRSVPSSMLESLADIPNIDWHSLQHEAELTSPDYVTTFSGGGDILQTAEVIRALDLLITVDSMPAHLAGALGVEVWNLLQYDADWRWMGGRDDTPWYPTMKLFRQDIPGDWTSVLARVSAELKQKLKSTVGL